MVKPLEKNNLKNFELFDKMISGIAINGETIDHELNSVIYTSHDYSLSKKENILKFTYNLQKFLSEKNILSLTFFMTKNENWLKYSHHDPVYKELADAYKFLKAGLNKNYFKGVFTSSFKDLKSFVPHLYSIRYYDPIVPHIYFASDNSDLLFHICSYCNLHIYFYGDSISCPDYFKTINLKEEKYFGGKYLNEN